MAASKLSFRARALDASRPMPVYLSEELPDVAECTPINRAVAQMPTGMEKDEEMELHIQEAIIAQQASTSGVNYENHVIPTPRVEETNLRAFERSYPVKSLPSKGPLIRVQAQLIIDKELPEYDLDSSDEEWLRKKPEIKPADLENIMHVLESASSDTQICQPKRAHDLLSLYDDDLIDDVYDYWLQKRKDAAADQFVPLLIPRIRTDGRRDAANIINPYVAFRRRAEKMQTRKNRKNDEESYEKMLKLSHDLRKAVTLFDMVKRREKSKLAVINLDAETVERRVALEDFQSTIYNQIIAKLKPEQFVAPVAAKFNGENVSNVTANVMPIPRSGKPRRRNRKATVSAFDRDLVNHAWLKKNAEVWNRPALFSTLDSLATTSSEAERLQAADSLVDGRYTFKRRRGCQYRSSVPLSSQRSEKMVESGGCEKFYGVFLPYKPASQVLRCIGVARRRIGRGGRIIFDRLIGATASSSKFDAPHPPLAFDSSRTFRSKSPSRLSSDSEVSDDEFNERYFHSNSDVFANLSLHGTLQATIPLTVGVRYTQYDAHRRRLMEREIALERLVEQRRADVAGSEETIRLLGKNPMQQFLSLQAVAAVEAVLDEQQLQNLEESRRRNRPPSRPGDGYDSVQPQPAIEPCENLNGTNPSGYSRVEVRFDERRRTPNGTEMEHATRKRFVSPGDALSVAVAPMSRVAIGPPVRLKEPTGQQSPAAVMFTCSPADADDKLAMSNGIQIVETTSLDVPGCNGDSYAVR